MNKRQNGFSLIELLIVVVIIGIIASIAIPNLLAARRSANEGSAISAIRTLHGAQISYASTYGNGNYAGTASGTADSVVMTQLGATGLVDALMTTGTKSGYIFKGARTVSSTAVPGTFFFAANPTTTTGVAQTGSRRFGIATNGVIMADPSTANLPTAFTATTIVTATPLTN